MPRIPPTRWANHVIFVSVHSPNAALSATKLWAPTNISPAAGIFFLAKNGPHRAHRHLQEPSGPRYFSQEEKIAENVSSGKYVQSVYGCKW